ncbi:MAG: hypothetical protein ACFBWO_16305 [Paracoccaceae bacterium]
MTYRHAPFATSLAVALTLTACAGYEPTPAPRAPASAAAVMPSDETAIRQRYAAMDAAPQIALKHMMANGDAGPMTYGDIGVDEASFVDMLIEHGLAVPAGEPMLRSRRFLLTDVGLARLPAILGL